MRPTYTDRQPLTIQTCPYGLATYCPRIPSPYDIPYIIRILSIYTRSEKFAEFSAATRCRRSTVKML